MQVYGGLINRLMENAKSPEPTVGMGATECMYSDRHACTIVEVRSPTTIVVQRDKAKRIDNNGMSESQTYEFTPNPEAPKVVVTKRRNGRWVAKGNKQSSPGFMLGERDEYYDFSH